uniref:EGF-like domain-containing protein n=1 Tax=Meloidogyne incognita TaxID=6306 RepID=A0A914LFA7_MELIC
MEILNGTREYPHTSTLPKSIKFGCDIKEYELNKGRCKNGGFPDPLKSCKCRCPDGYGGDYCTKYEYGFCRVTELKAKVEAQYINSLELTAVVMFTDFCLYVIKPHGALQPHHRDLEIKNQRKSG